MIKAKKVTILTGFLGAGKTTLLNSIFHHKQNTKFAIIENEVGEIGIDGELIIKNTDSFTELSNGCICCSLNNNFVDTLKILKERNDWDELIIEATGVANPGGIISPFKQYPWIQKFFQLPDLICIVDAQNIEQQLIISDTIASQLAYADKVYINKIDLVRKNQLDRVQKIIQEFNPFTYLYFGNKENIPIEELLFKKKSLRPVIQLKERTKPKPISNNEHDHFDAISLEYTIDFDEKKVFARLYTFLMAQSSGVYRFKGIFYDPRNKKKLIIQSVMKTLFIEEGQLWENEEDKISSFVFIGKNLQEKGLERMLKTCQLKALF